MRRHEQIAQYNQDNPSYYITGVKRMTQEQVNNWRRWSKSDLYELYQNPSDAKRASWRR